MGIDIDSTGVLDSVCAQLDAQQHNLNTRKKMTRQKALLFATSSFITPTQDYMPLYSDEPPQIFFETAAVYNNIAYPDWRITDNLGRRSNDEVARYHYNQLHALTARYVTRMDRLLHKVQEFSHALNNEAFSGDSSMVGVDEAVVNKEIASIALEMGALLQQLNYIEHVLPPVNQALFQPMKNSGFIQTSLSAYLNRDLSLRLVTELLEAISSWNCDCPSKDVLFQLTQHVAQTDYTIIGNEQAWLYIGR